MFEIICVYLFNGSFVSEKVEGDDVVDVMMKYFKDEGLRESFKRDIKRCEEGWYLKTEETNYLIRKC